MSLHLYKPLGSNDESVRLSTAHTLTTELNTLLTTECTPQSKKDVDYALSRLTKGLSSGSNSSRPGFAIVLTEFISSLQSSGNPEKWNISLETILGAVKNNTAPQSGHTTRPEERDYHLGRLFGLQSVLASGITTAPGREAAHKEVLNLLFELAKRKPWLRESCAWTVCESVQRGVTVEAATLAYAALVESGMAKTMEGVAVWLCVAAYHPGVAAPREVWGGGSPLGAGNLGTLGRILKDSGEEEGGAAKGTWNQKLHFVWDFIFAVYLAEDEVWSELRGSSEIAGWAELWRVVIDESLFSTSSSEERKFHGFLLFIKALDQITPSSPQHLAALFTKNFMRSFINQISDTSRYLNKVATKCSRALLAKAEAATWSAPIIVTQLITNNGTPTFDSLTKGKHVEKILCLADEDGLVQIVRVLRGIILTPAAGDIKTTEVRRQWACDQILSVVRSSKSVKSTGWLGEVVEMFTTFGHFDVLKLTTPISANSQGVFRSRLMSCLSHLITLKETTNDDETWPYRAVKTIGALKKADGYKLAIEIDDVIAEAIKSATKTLERIRKKRATSAGKDNTKSSQLSSFELLYSLVILQVYAGESDALGVLDELQICYDKVVRRAKKSSEDEDVDASQVLVEILLSFLSKPSVLLRKLAQQVFTSFVDQITTGGLEATFVILETKESLGGQQELFDGNEEDGEGDVDMNGSDDEEDSDVEVVDAEEMDLDEDTSDGDDSSAFDEEDEEGEVDETEAAKLETALAEALTASGAAANSDDDGSDMDDDAMLALDKHLITIFKQRSNEKSKKAETKAAKETIANFKNRVLDLLDIFAKSSRVLDIGISSAMILPLLRCTRRTASKPVADHAALVIRNFANSLRGKEVDVLSANGPQKEALWSLLEEIHAEAAKDGGPGREKHKAACSQASITIMKVLVASGGMQKEDVERAVGIYTKSLTKLLTDRTWRVQGGLFTDFVNWAVTAGKRLQNEVSK